MLTEDVVMDIAKTAIMKIIVCAAPLLLVSLIIGLVVSIFQTVTSIQEQTLTFVPKIIAVFIAIMLFGGWILNNCTSYAVELWNDFSIYVG